MTLGLELLEGAIDVCFVPVGRRVSVCPCVWATFNSKTNIIKNRMRKTKFMSIQIQWTKVTNLKQQNQYWSLSHGVF